jgi:hypothetical protein
MRPAAAAIRSCRPSPARQRCVPAAQPPARASASHDCQECCTPPSTPTLAAAQAQLVKGVSQVPWLLITNVQGDAAVQPLHDGRVVLAGGAEEERVGGWPGLARQAAAGGGGAGLKARSDLVCPGPVAGVQHSTGRHSSQQQPGPAPAQQQPGPAAAPPSGLAQQPAGSSGPAAAPPCPAAGPTGCTPVAAAAWPAAQRRAAPCACGCA